MEPEMQPVVVKTFVGATQTIAAEQFAADAIVRIERPATLMPIGNERKPLLHHHDRRRTSRPDGRSIGGHDRHPGC
jgi:hypothetical protein